MAGRVAGKVALITGAAEGIGAASARALGAEGAKLVLTDINDNGVKAFAAELERSGVSAIGLGHDVTDEAAWEAAMAAALSRFGKLDVLVNNAGIAFVGPTEETTLADWRRMLAVNLDGVFLGTKHAIRAMKGKGGSIINISSILGIDGAAQHRAVPGERQPEVAAIRRLNDVRQTRLAILKRHVGGGACIQPRRRRLRDGDAAHAGGSLVRRSATPRWLRIRAEYCRGRLAGHGCRASGADRYHKAPDAGDRRPACVQIGKQSGKGAVEPSAKFEEVVSLFA